MKGRAQPPAGRGCDARIDERRAFSRVPILHRAVAIRCPPDAEPAIAWLRDLCDQGLSLVTAGSADVGDLVEVVFADGQTQRGEIAWAMPDRLGVRFAERIDSAQLLIRSLRKHRSPRVRADLPAAVISEQGISSVRITDISRRGVKLSHDGKLPNHGQVRVVFPWGEARRGAICWSDANHAGMALDTEIDIDAFGSIDD